MQATCLIHNSVHSPQNTWLKIFYTIALIKGTLEQNFVQPMWDFVSVLIRNLERKLLFLTNIGLCEFSFNTIE